MLRGALGTLGQFSFVQQALAQTTPVFSDYKAVVCIFLFGGNDAYNMLIPTSTNANSGYSRYQSIRGNLAVSNTDLGLAAIAGGVSLNNGNLATGSGNPYYGDGSSSSAYLSGLYDLNATKNIPLGVNAMMPETGSAYYRQQSRCYC